MGKQTTFDSIGPANAQVISPENTLAARLGCGEGMVRRRVVSGEWESIKVDGFVRFTSAVVDAILADRRTAATEAEKDDDVT